MSRSKEPTIRSTSSFTIIWGQSSLYGKGLPLPKMWLSLSPKYQYTEQINFWIKEMFLAVIYILKITIRIPFRGKNLGEKKHL